MAYCCHPFVRSHKAYLLPDSGSDSESDSREARHSRMRLLLMQLSNGAAEAVTGRTWLPQVPVMQFQRAFATSCLCPFYTFGQEYQR